MKPIVSIVVPTPFTCPFNFSQNWLGQIKKGCLGKGQCLLDFGPKKCHGRHVPKNCPLLDVDIRVTGVADFQSRRVV